MKQSSARGDGFGRLYCWMEPLAAEGIGRLCASEFLRASRSLAPQRQVRSELTWTSQQVPHSRDRARDQRPRYEHGPEAELNLNGSIFALHALGAG